MNNRNRAAWAAGAAFVGILIILALGVPKAVNAMYDKSTLHHIEYQNAALSAYEVSYESFGEKLHELARCNGKDGGLCSVLVQEINSNMSDESLTDIVNQELALLAENKVLTEPLTVSPEHMESRDMYTIYTAEEVVSGIRYWKICYKEEDYELAVYLDTEFYKFYGIDITDRRTVAAETYVKVSEEGDIREFEKADKNMAPLDETYAWIDYWKLWSYEGYEIGLLEADVVSAYFEDDNSISFAAKYTIRDDHHIYMRSGIDLFADMTQL